MNFALTHFTLAFKVKISSHDDDCTRLITATPTESLER
jgi:hypothetical protein